MPEALTQRDIDRLDAAIEVGLRAKTPRPKFRVFHSAFEEYAMIFAEQFWREEALFQAKRAETLEARIRELQADSMSMGEPV